MVVCASQRGKLKPRRGAHSILVAAPLVIWIVLLFRDFSAFFSLDEHRPPASVLAGPGKVTGCKGHQGCTDAASVPLFVSFLLLDLCDRCWIM